VESSRLGFRWLRNPLIAFVAHHRRIVTYSFKLSLCSHLITVQRYLGYSILIFGIFPLLLLPDLTELSSFSNECEHELHLISTMRVISGDTGRDGRQQSFKGWPCFPHLNPSSYLFSYRSYPHCFQGPEAEDISTYAGSTYAGYL
jgi:hypothetical protein